jgi:hypothetical protein
MNTQGEQSYSSALSLTSVLDGDEWSMPHPSHFTPRKKPRWVCPWTGLVWMGAGMSPLLGFCPRTIQPQASCCLGSAILAQVSWQTKNNPSKKSSKKWKGHSEEMKSCWLFWILHWLGVYLSQGDVLHDGTLRHAESEHWTSTKYAVWIACYM